MKSFMNAESILVISHLIGEILDFKGYIRDYFASREEILVIICYFLVVKLALVEPIEVSTFLKNGCWPSTRVPVTRELLNMGEI